MSEEPETNDFEPETNDFETDTNDFEPEINEFESEITSDDKLWVLLTYVLSPLVPIIILFLEDKKNRPFIKAHNTQALILGIINVILGIMVGWTVFLSCVPLLLWVYMVYLGIQGYQGKYVNIPVISDFAKNQGWS